MRRDFGIAKSEIDPPRLALARYLSADVWLARTEGQDAERSSFTAYCGPYCRLEHRCDAQEEVARDPVAFLALHHGIILPGNRAARPMTAGDIIEAHRRKD